MTGSGPLVFALAILCALSHVLVACDRGTAARAADARPVADHGASGAASPARPQAPSTARTDAGMGTEEVRPPETGFLGTDERAIRASLASAPIASIEKGRGGRSLSFKITLADGTVGYFKPEQTFSAAHYYSELAAYYLDRALGFGRVPPAIGRRFDWAQLRASAMPDRRITEIEVAQDGTVRGAFLWWIPGGLTPLKLGRAWERVVRLEGGLARTPFDRPAAVRDGTAGASDPVREVSPARAGELSDLLIFDYLVQNVDRWGGDFTNVRTRANDGPLVFLDNGAGFWPNEQRLPLMEARLRPLQRFRRVTVDRLRAFDLAAYERALARDPLAPLLDARRIQGVGERVRAVVEHVDSMYARFGEAIWLP